MKNKIQDFLLKLDHPELNQKFISEKNKASYRLGCCPTAEVLQPKLLQFKTNYWDLDCAYDQAEILVRTLIELSPEI